MKTIVLLRLLLFVLATTFLSIQETSGITITWTNRNGGLWTDARNWNPNQVPGSLDEVRITASGDYTVNLNSAVTLSQGLRIGRGCRLEVAAGAVFTLSGDANTKMLEGSLHNAGTIILEGSPLVLWGDFERIAKLINLTNAVVDMRSSISRGGTSISDQLIENHGIWRKKGTNSSSIGVPFNNTGTLDVESGAVNLGGGSINSGLFNIASGTTLIFDGSYDAIYILNDGTRISGPGTNLWRASKITLNGNVTTANSVLAGATLHGTATISGFLLWTGGTLAPESVLTIDVGSVLALSGTATKTLQGILHNAGTIILDGIPLLLSGDSARLAKLINLTNAVVDSRASIQYGGASAADELIENHGVWRKTGGTGTSSIGVPFNNSGTLDVQSGTVNLSGGSISSGLFNIASGTTLIFDGSYDAIYILNDGTRISGTGTNLWRASKITLNGNVTTANSVLAGATLHGTATIGGFLSWTGGTLAPESVLTIDVGSVLALSGTATKTLQGVLHNAGTIILDGIPLLLSGDSARLAKLINLTNAVVDMRASIQYGGASAADELIENHGVWRKTGGTGTSSIGVPFNNTGTLDVQSGIVRLNGGYSITNGTINFGISGPSLNGKLEFLGSGVLGGTVGAYLRNGYVPVTGAFFQLVSGNPLSSRFDTANFPPEIVWTTNYTSSTFTLEVLDAVVVPRVQLSKPSASTLSFTWTGQGFFLERTSSLTNPEWTVLPNGSTPPVTVPSTEDQEFFRLNRR